MPSDPPQPWAGFLEELDDVLDESFVFHCIGGFAVVAAYGLPRSTNDLDYCSLIPCNRVDDLERLAGAGSKLARRHKVYVHHVGVALVPENYGDRLIELFPGHFKNIRLFVPDAYDLVLSKLGRNASRDRDDVAYLARTQQLDPTVLQERYEKELRANLTGDLAWHDQTLKFWAEAYFTKSEG